MKDPILAKIKSVLQTDGPPKLAEKLVITQVVPGVAKADLPVCFISNVSTTSTAVESGGGLDAQDDTKIVRLTVMVDWTTGNQWDGFGLDLIELIEGRDEDYSLKAQTILGALIKNRALGNNLFINVEGEFEINYPEPESLDSEEGFALTATVDFNVTF